MMMHVGEPYITATWLSVAGMLMLASVMLSGPPARVGIPIPLVFLSLGMLAGTWLPSFDNYELTFRIGTIALVLILFDGGLNTPFSTAKIGIRPAALLATVGVLITTGLVAVAAHVLGMGWLEGFLLGAVVSSTDAAVVFSVLRDSGVHIKKSLISVLEMESGLNDPMAVILTVALTEAAYGGRPLGWDVLLDIPKEIAIGAAFGAILGYLGRLFLTHLKFVSSGIAPVFTLGIAALAFGLPTQFHGSGFLAVYVASLILGNANIPFRSSLLHVHNSVAWLSQVVMFLLLGLLVTPSNLKAVAPIGLGIALFLAFFARPVATWLCLAPMRFPGRDIAYLGWVGLRGAVPIILATYAVLTSRGQADTLFDLVFFVVVVGALVPGGTVPWVTRKLGLELKQPPPSPAVLEINTTQALAGEVMNFYIEPSTLACATPLSALPFPAGAAMLLVVRGQDLIAPKGHTVLSAGDHIYVFCRPKDRQLLQMMFGSDSRGV